MTSTVPVLTEADLLGKVVTLANLYDWAYYHTWNSRHSTAGFPDLTLVRPPRLIFAELKSQKGRIAPAQREWLDRLAAVPGLEVYVWRPSLWSEGKIEEVLLVAWDVP